MTRITITNFKEAIKKSGGNQSIIAKRLEVTRGAITQFINKYPKMRDLVNIEGEKIIDAAENIIDSSITNKQDIDSAKWKLLHSKRGKSRGYGLKTEVEHSGEMDNKIEVEIIRVNKNEDDDESSDNRGV